jgi:hypothetical protein|tara:strand:+ start:52 stop:723 length:672 start_codon:yes stop_codon:yes gene_type:complete
MKTEIPKIIHQIWIGEEIPKKFKVFTQKMKNVHLPLGYEVNLWGNEIWDKYRNDPYIASYAKGNYPLAYVTDRFRMLLLRDYGGIAVDPDCEIVRSFDTIMDRLSENITYFAGARAEIDGGALFECGIQGSTPNSRVVKELLTVWDNLEFASGGLRTSNKLITILDTDVALLNHKHFFTYVINDKTILLHEPHTLDTWRDEKDREDKQAQRNKIVTELNRNSV